MTRGTLSVDYGDYQVKPDLPSDATYPHFCEVQQQHYSACASAFHDIQRISRELNSDDAFLDVNIEILKGSLYLLFGKSSNRKLEPYHAKFLAFRARVDNLSKKSKTSEFKRFLDGYAEFLPEMKTAISALRNQALLNDADKMSARPLVETQNHLRDAIEKLVNCFAYFFSETGGEPDEQAKRAAQTQLKLEFCAVLNCRLDHSGTTTFADVVEAHRSDPNFEKKWPEFIANVNRFARDKYDERSNNPHAQNVLSNKFSPLTELLTKFSHCHNAIKYLDDHIHSLQRCPESYFTFYPPHFLLMLNYVLGEILDWIANARKEVNGYRIVANMPEGTRQGGRITTGYRSQLNDAFDALESTLTAMRDGIAATAFRLTQASFSTARDFTGHHYTTNVQKMVDHMEGAGTLTEGVALSKCGRITPECYAGLCHLVLSHGALDEKEALQTWSASATRPAWSNAVARFDLGSVRPVKLVNGEFADNLTEEDSRKVAAGEYYLVRRWVLADPVIDEPADDAASANGNVVDAARAALFGSNDDDPASAAPVVENQFAYRVYYCSQNRADATVADKVFLPESDEAKSLTAAFGENAPEAVLDQLPTVETIERAIYARSVRPSSGYYVIRSPEDEFPAMSGPRPFIDFLGFAVQNVLDTNPVQAIDELQPGDLFRGQADFDQVLSQFFLTRHSPREMTDYGSYGLDFAREDLKKRQAWGGYKYTPHPKSRAIYDKLCGPFKELTKAVGVVDMWAAVIERGGHNDLPLPEFDQYTIIQNLRSVEKYLEELRDILASIKGAGVRSVLLRKVLKTCINVYEVWLFNSKFKLYQHILLRLQGEHATFLRVSRPGEKYREVVSLEVGRETADTFLSKKSYQAYKAFLGETSEELGQHYRQKRSLLNRYGCAITAETDETVASVINRSIGCGVTRFNAKTDFFFDFIKTVFCYRHTPRLHSHVLRKLKLYLRLMERYGEEGNPLDNPNPEFVWAKTLYRCLEPGQQPLSINQFAYLQEEWIRLLDQRGQAWKKHLVDEFFFGEGSNKLELKREQHEFYTNDGNVNDETLKIALIDTLAVHHIERRPPHSRSRLDFKILAACSRLRFDWKEAKDLANLDLDKLYGAINAAQPPWRIKLANLREHRGQFNSEGHFVGRSMPDNMPRTVAETDAEIQALQTDASKWSFSEQMATYEYERERLGLLICILERLVDIDRLEPKQYASRARLQRELHDFKENYTLFCLSNRREPIDFDTLAAYDQVLGDTYTELTDIENKIETAKRARAERDNAFSLCLYGAVAPNTPANRVNKGNFNITLDPFLRSFKDIDALKNMLHFKIANVETLEQYLQDCLERIRNSTDSRINRLLQHREPLVRAILRWLKSDRNELSRSIIAIFAFWAKSPKNTVPNVFRTQDDNFSLAALLRVVSYFLTSNQDRDALPTALRGLRRFNSLERFATELEANASIFGPQQTVLIEPNLDDCPGNATAAISESHARIKGRLAVMPLCDIAAVLGRQGAIPENDDLAFLSDLYEPDGLNDPKHSASDKRLVAQVIGAITLNVAINTEAGFDQFHKRISWAVDKVAFEPQKEERSGKGLLENIFLFSQLPLPDLAGRYLFDYWEYVFGQNQSIQEAECTRSFRELKSFVSQLTLKKVRCDLSQYLPKLQNYINNSACYVNLELLMFLVDLIQLHIEPAAVKELLSSIRNNLFIYLLASPKLSDLANQQSSGLEIYERCEAFLAESMEGGASQPTPALLRGSANLFFDIAYRTDKQNGLTYYIREDAFARKTAAQRPADTVYFDCFGDVVFTQLNSKFEPINVTDTLDLFICDGVLSTDGHLNPILTDINKLRLLRLDSVNGKDGALPKVWQQQSAALLIAHYLSAPSSVSNLGLGGTPVQSEQWNLVTTVLKRCDGQFDDAICVFLRDKISEALWSAESMQSMLVDELWFDVILKLKSQVENGYDQQVSINQWALEKVIVFYLENEQLIDSMSQGEKDLLLKLFKHAAREGFFTDSTFQTQRIKAAVYRYLYSPRPIDDRFLLGNLDDQDGFFATFTNDRNHFNDEGNGDRTVIYELFAKLTQDGFIQSEWRNARDAVANERLERGVADGIIDIIDDLFLKLKASLDRSHSPSGELTAILEQLYRLYPRLLLPLTFAGETQTPLLSVKYDRKYRKGSSIAKTIVDRLMRNIDLLVLASTIADEDPIARSGEGSVQAVGVYDLFSRLETLTSEMIKDRSEPHLKSTHAIVAIDKTEFFIKLKESGEYLKVEDPSLYSVTELFVYSGQFAERGNNAYISVVDYCDANAFTGSNWSSASTDVDTENVVGFYYGPEMGRRVHIIPTATPDEPAAAIPQQFEAIITDLNLSPVSEVFLSSKSSSDPIYRQLSQIQVAQIKAAVRQLINFSLAAVAKDYPVNPLPTGDIDQNQEANYRNFLDASSKYKNNLAHHVKLAGKLIESVGTNVRLKSALQQALIREFKHLCNMPDTSSSQNVRDGAHLMRLSLGLLRFSEYFEDLPVEAQTVQDPTAQDSATQQDPTAQGSTAQDSVTQQDPTAQGSTAQDSVTQQDPTAQGSTAQDSVTQQDPTAQGSTAQDSVTQQDPTAQGSTAQDSATQQDPTTQAPLMCALANTVLEFLNPSAKPGVFALNDSEVLNVKFISHADLSSLKWNPANFERDTYYIILDETPEIDAFRDENNARKIQKSFDVRVMFVSRDKNSPTLRYDWIDLTNERYEALASELKTNEVFYLHQFGQSQLAPNLVKERMQQLKQQLYVCDYKDRITNSAKELNEQLQILVDWSGRLNLEMAAYTDANFFSDAGDMSGNNVALNGDKEQRVREHLDEAKEKFQQNLTAEIKNAFQTQNLENAKSLINVACEMSRRLPDAFGFIAVLVDELLAILTNPPTDSQDLTPFFSILSELVYYKKQFQEGLKSSIKAAFQFSNYENAQNLVDNAVNMSVEYPGSLNFIGFLLEELRNMTVEWQDRSHSNGDIDRFDDLIRALENEAGFGQDDAFVEASHEGVSGGGVFAGDHDQGLIMSVGVVDPVIQCYAAFLSSIMIEDNVSEDDCYDFIDKAMRFQFSELGELSWKYFYDCIKSMTEAGVIDSTKAKAIVISLFKNLPAVYLSAKTWSEYHQYVSQQQDYVDWVASAINCVMNDLPLFVETNSFEGNVNAFLAECGLLESVVEDRPDMFLELHVHSQQTLIELMGLEREVNYLLNDNNLYLVRMAESVYAIYDIYRGEIVRCDLSVMLNRQVEESYNAESAQIILSENLRSQIATFAYSAEGLVTDQQRIKIEHKEQRHCSIYKKDDGSYVLYFGVLGHHFMFPLNPEIMRNPEKGRSLIQKLDNLVFDQDELRNLGISINNHQHGGDVDAIYEAVRDVLHDLYPGCGTKYLTMLLLKNALPFLNFYQGAEPSPLTEARLLPFLSEYIPPQYFDVETMHAAGNPPEPNEAIMLARDILQQNTFASLVNGGRYLEGGALSTLSHFVGEQSKRMESIFFHIDDTLSHALRDFLVEQQGIQQLTDHIANALNILEISWDDYDFYDQCQQGQQAYPEHLNSRVARQQAFTEARQQLTVAVQRYLTEFAKLRTLFVAVAAWTKGSVPSSNSDIKQILTECETLCVFLLNTQGVAVLSDHADIFIAILNHGSNNTKRTVIEALKTLPRLPDEYQTCLDTESTSVAAQCIQEIECSNRLVSLLQEEYGDLSGNYHYDRTRHAKKWNNELSQFNQMVIDPNVAAHKKIVRYLHVFAFNVPDDVNVALIKQTHAFVIRKNAREMLTSQLDLIETLRAMTRDQFEYCIEALIDEDYVFWLDKIANMLTPQDSDVAMAVADFSGEFFVKRLSMQLVVLKDPLSDHAAAIKRFVKLISGFLPSLNKILNSLPDDAERLSRISRIIYNFNSICDGAGCREFLANSIESLFKDEQISDQGMKNLLLAFIRFGARAGQRFGNQQSLVGLFDEIEHRFITPGGIGIGVWHRILGRDLPRYDGTGEGLSGESEIADGPHVLTTFNSASLFGSGSSHRSGGEVNPVSPPPSYVTQSGSAGGSSSSRGKSNQSSTDFRLPRSTTTGIYSLA